jgi:hypothetical protein
VEYEAFLDSHCDKGLQPLLLLLTYLFLMLFIVLDPNFPFPIVGNEKRGRGRPNLTWEESVKRDLKDWSITKELALDRREWKLAIHVPEP